MDVCGRLRSTCAIYSQSSSFLFWLFRFVFCWLAWCGVPVSGLSESPLTVESHRTPRCAYECRSPRRLPVSKLEEVFLKKKKPSWSKTFLEEAFLWETFLEIVSNILKHLKLSLKRWKHCRSHSYRRRLRSAISGSMLILRAFATLSLFRKRVISTISLGHFDYFCYFSLHAFQKFKIRKFGNPNFGIHQIQSMRLSIAQDRTLKCLNNI